MRDNILAKEPKANLAVYSVWLPELGWFGLDPTSIGLVVMTHLHYDHASGISQFPGATFVVTEREWRAAHRRASAVRGYVRGHFDHPFDWRTLDFHAPGVTSFATFGRSLDLFGDGSVIILFTPGHTHGHMSVVLRLAGPRDPVLRLLLPRRTEVGFAETRAPHRTVRRL